MDAHTRKVYVPMTETGFYILFCLQKENHGYGIVQTVERMTGGEIRLAPGTMYGSLSKMEKDGVIRFVREEEKRKIYVITDLGREVLDLERKRICRLYRSIQEEIGYENEKRIPVFYHIQSQKGRILPAGYAQIRLAICESQRIGHVSF